MAGSGTAGQIYPEMPPGAVVSPMRREFGLFALIIISRSEAASVNPGSFKL
jgi:hypothetical protein